MMQRTFPIVFNHFDDDIIFLYFRNAHIFLSSPSFTSYLLMYLLSVIDIYIYIYILGFRISEGFFPDANRFASSVDRHTDTLSFHSRTTDRVRLIPRLSAARSTRLPRLPNVARAESPQWHVQGVDEAACTAVRAVRSRYTTQLMEVDISLQR